MNKVILSSEKLAEAKLKLVNKDKDAFKFVALLYNQVDPQSNFVLIAELAVMYSKMVGNLKSNYLKSVEIIVKTFSDKRIAELPLSRKAELAFFLGIFHHYLGNYLEAFKNYHDAIEIYETIEDISTNDELNIANGLINIGALHKLTDYTNYEKKDINRALSIYNKHKAKFGIANCYNLFAAYSLANKNYSECLSYYKKSISLNIELDNEVGVALNLLNISCMYTVKKDFKTAFTYMKKSFDKIQKLDNELIMAIFYKNAADTYLLSNDLRKSVTHYRLALSFFEDKGHKDELLNIYKGLADVYSKTKQFKKAFQYLEKHIEMKQSAFKFEKAIALYNIKRRDKQS